MTARWQGSFKVLRKCGPTTYEVETSGQKLPKWILHVNLLKEWFPRSEDKGEPLLIQRVADKEESYYTLDHLSQSQQPAVQKLCDPQVFQGTQI